MALIKCPFCGAEISGSAKFCPVCGKSLEQAVVTAEIPASAKKSQTPLIIGLSVACALLLGGLLAFLFMNKGNKGEAPVETAVGQTVTPVTPPPTYSAPGSAAASTVYSSAYDGYVVMRACPSSNCDRVGKFRNGPMGATYLGEQGGWTQINYNGVVGWVNSSYVSWNPTKEVTVDVDGDSLEGIWSDNGFCYYLIFNNGKYYMEWDTSEGGIIRGHWYLEEDNLFLVPDRYDLPDYMGKPNTESHKIRHQSIESFSRVSYVSEEDAKRYREEGMGGSLWWTKKDFRRLKSKSY